MKKETKIVIALLAVMIIIVSVMVERILHNPGFALIAIMSLYFALSDGK